MLGPLTLQVGKAFDGYHNRLSREVSNKLATMVKLGDSSIEVTMLLTPVIRAAWTVYKGEGFHPKILWGNFWFLYYQAWLWKFSREWREKVTEVWLERLRSKGKLEQFLYLLQGFRP